MAGELLPVYIRTAFLPLCGVCFSSLDEKTTTVGPPKFCLVAAGEGVGKLVQNSQLDPC